MLWEDPYIHPWVRINIKKGLSNLKPFWHWFKLLLFMSTARIVHFSVHWLWRFILFLLRCLLTAKSI